MQPCSPATGTVSSTLRVNPLLGVLLVAAFASVSACKPDAAAPVSETKSDVDAVTSSPEGATSSSASTTASTTASSADALIGKTMPPYPDGLENVEGSCVPGGDGLDHACDFGLAILARPSPSGVPIAQYLIASSNTDTATPQPEWQVTDALDAPSVADGYGLQLTGCRLDGASSAGIVAIVRHGKAEYSSDVTWARRFDTATGKLVEVDLKHVDCVDPGYGV